MLLCLSHIRSAIAVENRLFRRVGILLLHDEGEKFTPDRHIHRVSYVKVTSGLGFANYLVRRFMSTVALIITMPEKGRRSHQLAKITRLSPEPVTNEEDRNIRQVEGWRSLEFARGIERPRGG